MPRPLRLDFPGAWHHVMNRGRRGERIYLDPTDHRRFLTALENAAVEFNAGVAAYCLMPNHYHLLVHTPGGNLSRFMRHIGGVYTQAFNNRHGLDGQLFRGRYKSILVHGDNYLLQLVRYIHRNPMKAGLRASLCFPWSSHGAYSTGEAKWDWMYTSSVLSMLDADDGEARRRYRAFAAEDGDTEADLQLSRQRLPAVIGSCKFVKRIRSRFKGKVLVRDVTTPKEFAADPDTILAAVCHEARVSHEFLFKMRRGVSNESRDLAM